ncbi:MAG TPA: protein kinase [Fimbriiglobus sp.]|jgi:serine/threonine protein kinase
MKTSILTAREVFGAAVKLPPEQWDVYLAVACSGEDELRRNVRDLLKAHREAGSFLNAAEPRSSAAGDEPIREGPGTVIGPYKLLEQIGEGGFGVVFMAEQMHPVRRKVALKILKPGMDTRQVVARFEAERQALAVMDHPNIAHVFDGGQSSSGRPFFVMELVRGIPITETCDENHLPVRERLELFIHVCEAVQHAHQKGIIHRDLKPSNVLVTVHDSRLVPKIIDFGISKAIGQQLTEKTLFTNFAQMIGTPLYMSPEQAQMSGLDIDTRTDIYALGVLLYELLTGTTPFDRERLRAAGVDEIRRIIREEEPPKPSTRMSTLGRAASTVFDRRTGDGRQFGRRFRGDLDWIVMKCLEKDRERRYQTSTALAADLRHYLHNEPVLARPPSVWYRFSKFARRNRAALLVTASTVSALVATVVTLAVANRMLHHEEQRTKDALTEARGQQIRAEANFQRAMDAVDQMLTRVAEDRVAHPGLDPVRRRLLEDALKFYQEFLQERGSDPQVRFEAARAYGRVAEIHTSLGQYPQAEDANRRALALAEGLSDEFPDRPKFASEVAASHYRTAMMLRITGGRNADAERHCRDAVAILERLVAHLPRGESQNLRHRLAMAHQEMGYMLIGRPERVTEGERAYQAALALNQELIDEATDLNAYRNERANLYNGLGVFYRMNGRPREAEQAHRQALAILAKLSADFPGSHFRDEEKRAYEHLSFALWQQDRRDEAIDAASRVLEIDRRLDGKSQNPGDRGDRAIHYLSLGQMFEGRGRTTEAEEAYRSALTLADQERTEYAAVPNGNDAWIDVHFSLCRLLAATRRLEEAKQLFGKVAAWTPPSDKGQNLLAWRLVTGSDERFRDGARAVELARKLVDRVPGDGLYRNTLGVAEYRAGEWNAAVATLQKSEELLAGGQASFNQFFLAMAHWKLGEKAQARRNYDRAVQWMEKYKPRDGELLRFRAEAAQLLDVPPTPNQPASAKPGGKKPDGKN